MIWEAGRATSAAATFFDPISIGPYGEEFIDGATESNNPIEKLMEEARQVWGNIDDRLDCIVSIGTGQPPVKPWGNNALEVIDTLKALATETERTATRFRNSQDGQKWSSRYFRLNVDRGLENIGLEEHTKRDQLVTATRIYLDKPDTRDSVKRFLSVVRGAFTAFRGDQLHQSIQRVEVRGALTAFGGDELLQSFQRMHGMDLEDHFADVNDPEANTFQWIFHRQAVVSSWNSQSSEILLITGKPGCGKTVLAKMLYEDWTKRLAQNSPDRPEMAVESAELFLPTIILFFACSDRDAKRRTPSNILSALIAQTLKHLESLAERPCILVNLYKMYRKRDLMVEVAWKLPRLCEIFASLMISGALKGIVCIVDALDECEPGSERTMILRCINEIVEKCDETGICFKLIATSRYYHDIRFDGSKANRFDLDSEEDMDNDLDSFIQAGVTKLLQTRPGYKVHETRVTQMLHARADKMYWLVKLLLGLLDEITDSSPHGVNEALVSLPSDLAGVYKTLWDRIKPQDKERANVWLSWILLAFQSLTINQLAAAFTIYSRRGVNIDPDVYPCLQSTLQEDLHRLFGPLIRFRALGQDHEIHVEATHGTVKEYFRPGANEDLSPNPVLIASHTMMAEVCLFWDPYSQCKFDHMAEVVGKHFRDSVDIESSAALLARDIWTETHPPIWKLPFPLMRSTFKLYADPGAREHLVIALVNMIIRINPSLRAQSSTIEAIFLQSIHRSRFGTTVLVHGKGKQRKEMVAVCDPDRQANEIESAVIISLGLENSVVVEKEETEASTKSGRGSPTSYNRVLNLKLAVLPGTVALEKKFTVVNGLVCDLLLGQDYLTFQSSDVSGSLTRQWSKRPVPTTTLGCNYMTLEE